jgi:hypothetical protein
MSRYLRSRLRSRRGLILLLSLFLGALLLISPLYQTITLYMHAILNSSVDMTQAPVRRMVEDAVQATARLRQAVFASRQAGLPAVRLYAPVRAQLALLADPPASISQWQGGSLVYPDGKLRNIKIKHRGDSNPVNYALAKKSWRIKTKRKALFHGRRVLSYVVPQSEDMIQEAVVIWMAHRMDLLAPRVRLVELFINDKSQGIYYEIERLDEIFLRANSIMPVNIYKGDRDQDTLKGFSRNLFQSSVIWSKNAENNRYQTADHSDLQRFLELVRSAASSNADWVKLRRQAPFEHWAKFSAFQILTQSWHNDASHNMRLLIDDQSGTVRPIPWDVGGEWEPAGFHMNKASHPLLALYRRSSAFLLMELTTLYHYTVHDRLLAGAQAFINQLGSAFQPSLERDTGRLQVLPLSRALPLLYNPGDSLKTHTSMQTSLENRHNWLVKKLDGPPQATWKLRDGVFDMVVSDLLPLSKLTIGLSPGAPQPTILAFDGNNNRKLDADDTILPFRLVDNRLVINAIWLANRTRRPKLGPLHGVDGFMGWLFDIQPTHFSLVSDQPLAATSASGQNPLTGRAVALKQIAREGQRPALFNRPLLAKSAHKVEVWRGDRHIQRTMVMENPLRIEAGSNIVMEPGTSLVFRGKLIIAGTDAEPVRIYGTGKGPWGTFALQGGGTKGSRLMHLDMEGGSGDHIDDVAYLAMLSIHATSDVIVSNLKMRRNHIYDDMLHVVYGRQIRLDQLHLTEARSDAIDIDISDVTISDSKISNIGNDCIDLMTSRALIERVVLSNCGDKGTSVGEASNMALVNSVIRNSAIGIEIKDGSTVQALHTDFFANNVQINAYKKNWRYASGGHAVVLKSHLASPASRNVLRTDKKSTLIIHDSSLVNGADIKKNVMIADDTDRTDSRRARASGYGIELLPLLKGVDLDTLRNRRGASPQ